jgi:hypothetical protein
MAEIGGGHEIGRIESALLSIDDGVLGVLYRVAIGFVTMPAMLLLSGNDASEWALVPFLLSVLLLLRIVPAVVRKLVPFSGTVQEVWAARRRTAKRYDSYQWRKLLWIGVGLALYAATSGQFSPALIAVCSTCLAAGAAGMVSWRVMSARGRRATVPSVA